MYRLQTKRKIRRKWKTVVAVVLVLAVMMGSNLDWNEKRVEDEPDVISSVIINDKKYLTVVTNRNAIEHKEELKKQQIKMYEENSFYSVKFLTDMIDLGKFI